MDGPAIRSGWVRRTNMLPHWVRHTNMLPHAFSQQVCHRCDIAGSVGCHASHRRSQLHRQKNSGRDFFLGSQHGKLRAHTHTRQGITKLHQAHPGGRQARLTSISSSGVYHPVICHSKVSASECDHMKPIPLFSCIQLVVANHMFGTLNQTVSEVN